jgi:isocitrate dehydrogenase
VWSALFQVLELGCVTQDLSRHVPNAKVITTSEFGSLVLDELA